MSSHDNSQEAREIALVLALLALTVLGAFVGVDGGNMWGVDEWPHTYAASRGAISYHTGRLLAILPVFLGYQIADNAPLPGFMLTLALRVALALLVYLLLREYAPRRRLFAYASAAFTLAFLVRDFFLLWAFSAVGNLYGKTVLALLALYLQARHAHGGRPAYLLGSLAVMLITALSYEGSVPLLLGIPWLALLLEGDLSRRRIAVTGIWSAALIAVSAWYALSLFGLGGSTYQSSVFTGLDPARLLRSTITQLRVFDDLPFTKIEQFRTFWPALPLGAAVTVGCCLAAGHHLRDDTPPGETTAARVRRALLWLGIGLVITFLGFAAYLPTTYGQSIERVYILAAPGAGILLAALVWLAGSFFSTRASPRITRTIAFAFLVMVGLYNINAMQAVNEEYAAVWDSQAVYLRRLAHLIPAAEPNTLLVRVVDDPDTPLPFNYGYAFQYAVRYLYEDSVLAAVTQGPLIGHDLVVDDSGLQVVLRANMQPDNPLSHPSRHGWDEVIFLRQDEHGRPVILDTLPEQYATPAREALYNPQARIIRSAPLPPRVLSLLPPLQSIPAAPGM